MSSMNVWRSGTTRVRRARARGPRRGSGRRRARRCQRRRAFSSCERVLERQAARGQQHGQVVEHVGRLGRARARRSPRARRARPPRPPPRPSAPINGGSASSLAVYEPPSVAGAPRALGDRALERGQRLVRRGRSRRRRCGSRCARRCGRPGRPARRARAARRRRSRSAAPRTRSDVARRLALVPQLGARARPEPGLAGLDRARQASAFM